MTNQLPDQLPSAEPDSAPPSSAPPSSAPPRASSGPRTPAGKAASSQNARKHDLCSKTLRLSPEEWVEYNDMRERYGRDLQPAGDLEENLVDEICFNYWRSSKPARSSSNHSRHPTELPIIALYIRYRTGYERAFYKALDKLQKAQSIRKKNANLDSVRSAESQSAPVAAVRSAVPVGEQEIDEMATYLEDRLETHLLENKMRAVQQLSPLEIPAKLAAQLRGFVSQNPGALPKHLVEVVGKAA